jgi:hypothetical protein
MPTQQRASHSKSKSKHKAAAKPAHKPAVKAAPKKEEHKQKMAPARAPVKKAAASRGEGAHATGPADFTINRKWSKTLEPKVGAHIRVELPENALRGMAWQLHKLPHGVALDEAQIQQITPPEGLHNQNRVFNFSVHEAGDYTLQFNLARFGTSGVADTFKLKVSAKDKSN